MQNNVSLFAESPERVVKFLNNTFGGEVKQCQVSKNLSLCLDETTSSEIVVLPKSVPMDTGTQSFNRPGVSVGFNVRACTKELIIKLEEEGWKKQLKKAGRKEILEFWLENKISLEYHSHEGETEGLLIARS